MALRYWIGNGGSYSDTAHWATVSGGSGGASVPTQNDDVVFDDNGITITGQTITISGTRNCASFTNTSTNLPTFTIGGLSINRLSVFGNFNATGTQWTAIPSGKLITDYIRFRGTGAVTVTTGGVQLPSIDWENGNAGDVTYTCTDNIVLQPTQFSYFKPTTDLGIVNILASGKTMTWPRVDIFCNQVVLDNFTITITELLQIINSTSMTCNGTVWNVTGATINVDGSGNTIDFGSSSTWAMNSSEGVTLNSITITNSIGTSSIGAMKVRIFPEDPPGTGDGGGNSGWTFIRAHIQSPPTRIVTPPTFSLIADRVLTPPTKPGA